MNGKRLFSRVHLAFAAAAVLAGRKSRRAGALWGYGVAGLLALSLPARAAFEDIGAGARTIGLGSAFTAVADDASSAYFNAAGLAQVKRYQFIGSYGRLFMGLSDGSNLGSGYVSMLVPLKEGAWGTAAVSALTLSLSGAYQEDVYAASYGRQLTPSLYAGGSLKLLRKGYKQDAYTVTDPLFTQFGYNASALSLDLGLLYKLSPNYVFGASVRDLNRPDLGLGAADEVPPALKVGVAYYQPALVVSGELGRKGSDTLLNLGAERWFYEHFVAARAGFEFGSRSKRNLAVGASARRGSAQVDYAFLFPLSGVVGTSGSHRLGLTVRFGGPDPEPISLLYADEAEKVARDAQLDELRREVEKCGVDRCQALESAREDEKLAAKVAALESQLKSMKEAPPPPAPAPAAVPASTAPLVMPAPANDERYEILERNLAAERAELVKLRRERLIFKRPGLYVVKEGDTLQSIAAYTMGDREKWVEIYRMNKDRMKRAGEVTPGDLLIIP